MAVDNVTPIHESDMTTGRNPTDPVWLARGLATLMVLAALACSDNDSNGDETDGEAASTVDAAADGDSNPGEVVEPEDAGSGNYLHLAFGTEPAEAADVGEPWPLFTVEVRLDDGTRYEWDTDVTLTLTQGDQGLLEGGTQSTIRGVATFNDVAYSNIEDLVFDVVATPDIDPIVGVSMTVREPIPETTADHLRLGFDPETLDFYVDEVFPTLLIRVVDIDENTVVDYQNAVTVNLAEGSGRLSGLTGLVASSGEVPFNELTYNVAEDITLEFASENLPSLFLDITVEEPE